MPERAQPELSAALLSLQELKQQLKHLAEAGVGTTSSPVPSTRGGSGAIEEAIPDESDPPAIEQEDENTPSRCKEHTYKSSTETPPDGKKE